MLNKNAYKMLNFCPIFIILGLLKAELYWQNSKLSKFDRSSIQIAKRWSKVQHKNEVNISIQWLHQLLTELHNSSKNRIILITNLSVARECASHIQWGTYFDISHQSQTIVFYREQYFGVLRKYRSEACGRRLCLV